MEKFPHENFELRRNVQFPLLLPWPMGTDRGSSRSWYKALTEHLPAGSWFRAPKKHFFKKGNSRHVIIEDNHSDAIK